MVTKSLDHWKPKREAAELLQCSEKTVERMATRKEIQKALRRSPGKPPMVVYHPEDIESLRRAMSTTEAFPISSDDSAVDGERSLPARRAGASDLILQLADALSPARDTAPSLSDLGHKIYLTLEEAARYSGLTKSLLLQKLKADKLKGFKDRGWKIRRVDLEAL